jgi:MutS domain V/MutS domain III
VHSPSHEYSERLARRRAARDRLSGVDARFAQARLTTFASAVFLALLAWRSAVSGWWLLAPVVLFVWLMRRHDLVLRSRDAAQRGIAFYERGLARLEDRWVGTGEPGERFRDDGHVYANDLDLFGRGSLFELLSLARTRSGEETLARWLTSPADAAEIQARQDAVAELSSALDLREQLALAGGDVRASVQTDRLLEWAESPLARHPWLQVFTRVSTAAVLLAIPYVAITGSWWVLGTVAALEAMVFSRLREQMNAILSAKDIGQASHFVADALSHRSSDLAVVADLLRHLERQQFRCNRLATLGSSLAAEGLPASRIIRRLQRLSEIHDSQKNAALLPLVLFLSGQIALAVGVAAVLQLVRPNVALAVRRWRTRHGAEVRVWVETVAQFEALSSLSGYRYERSEDPFPEIVSTDQATGAVGLFVGIQLGHPLLPRATMVPNDVCLGDGMQLLVVSGSNMSGKSTLLRTVGINAVLALAGAPVRATSLRLSSLAIGGTLRIQDSLQEGRSRFYAEITRIRNLADIAAGPVPLLFLLDEIFHGTNSHDRLQGAAGVLQSLLDRGAIGLITTHDLALTSVTDELSPRAANVHFADWFEEDDIRFDYRMKPGPVTRSNALALMRAVGLDVPSQTQARD